MCLQHHRFDALSGELTSLARSMTLQIFLCEQIADSGVHKHYGVINVILDTTCDYCLENGKPRNPQNNEPPSGLLIPSPAWAIQVEQLFQLMTSVAHDVSESSLPRRSVERSLRSIAGLSKILSRQRRHMQRISVRRPTEMNVIDDCSPACPDCGHRYEVTNTEEDSINVHKND